MKKKKILNISVFIFFASIALFFGCKEEEEVFPETRLFRPVLNEDLFSIDNTVIVNMGKLKLTPVMWK